jgi:phenylacetate-coenzyme A ligase PaaK-like adenylate-forming protein
MWNPGAEAMPAEELAGLQAERLRALVARLGRASEFFGRRLADAGVDADAPLRLDDLGALPFTTKTDLWEHYPWGLLAVPREQVVRVHGSSGTGGRPTLVAYSRADLALWAEVCARALGCAGAVIPHTQLTAERLSAALAKTLGSARHRASATALGQKVTQERGVETASRLIERMAAGLARAESPAA